MGYCHSIFLNVKEKLDGEHTFFLVYQRQLSLKANEIQERLIKNKSLLNAVEPALECQSLELLLGILQRRIELDKEVLFQFTQLKKEFDIPPNGLSSSVKSSVAPLLMKYQRGCQQVRQKHDLFAVHAGFRGQFSSTQLRSLNPKVVAKRVTYVLVV